MRNLSAAAELLVLVIFIKNNLDLRCLLIFKGDENDPELAYRDIAKFNIVQVAGELSALLFRKLRVILLHSVFVQIARFDGVTLDLSYLLKANFCNL